MKLLKLLSIGIVSLLLISCTSIKTNSTTSPDEAWLALCPKIEAVAPKDFGETWEQLNNLTDQYTACRLRHNAWVEFERKRIK